MSLSRSRALPLLYLCCLFSLHAALPGRSYRHLHFTDEKTKARVMKPLAQSHMAKPDFGLMSLLSPDSWGDGSCQVEMKTQVWESTLVYLVPLPLNVSHLRPPFPHLENGNDTPALLAPGESRALVEDFPGGPVDKNPSANTGDTGSISSLGSPHTLWSH